MNRLTLSQENMNIAYDMKTISEKTRVYLGVDVGSISTNLVVIDEQTQCTGKEIPDD